MNIDCKFNLKERVRIPELNREGVVTALMIYDAGLSVRVRYFDHGKAESTWFYPDELQPKS